MSLAVLCSGQGRQHSEMFALTGNIPESQAIFVAATVALGGQDPRNLLRLGDDDAIHANLAGQVLCCTQALAACAALRDLLGPDLILAGYSVGEVAAWGCAGIFSARATLALVRLRADIMDEIGGPGGGLAFVRGLERTKVDALCGRFDLAVAIVNPAHTYVVGGERGRLGAFCAAATQAGANRTGLLAVNVASHTAGLAAASPRFRAALHEAQPARRLPPGVRLLSGIDGETVLDPERGADKLAAQISQTVQWAACLQSCVEAGAKTFLELGPGRALAEMVEAAYPELRARSVEDFRSLDGVRTWVARAAA